MKLYHCPATRSLRPLWLLEELAVDYELERVDIFSGAGHQQDYRAINPLGAVPALEVDGRVICEAGAICSWLTEQYPDHHLAPAIDDPARARYHQWMFFVPATMEPPLFDIIRHTRLLPQEERIPQAITLAQRRFDKIAEVLNQAVAGQPFLLGEQFSTADIMLATTLQWLPKMVEPFAELKDYGDRMIARPAYQKALSL